MKQPQPTNPVYEWRQAADLTQRQLAEAVGISLRTVINVEAGVRRPRMKTRTKLCKFFNVDINTHRKLFGPLPKEETK
jgi:DNA-binding XRE family transcriptional regulator